MGLSKKLYSARKGMWYKIIIKTMDYHAKTFVLELNKRCSADSVEKLAGAVAAACG